MVIMDISEHKPGQVKVKGQVWTAISESGYPVQADTEVIITAIEELSL